MGYLFLLNKNLFSCIIQKRERRRQCLVTAHSLFVVSHRLSLGLGLVLPLPCSRQTPCFTTSLPLLLLWSVLTLCTIFLRAGKVSKKETEVAGEIEEAEQEECIHQWHIESPKGPTSLRTCRKCKKQKRFSNAFIEPYRVYSTIPLNSDADRVEEWLSRQNQGRED